MSKDNQNSFSVSKRLVSFKYAFKGISFMVKTQHNSWIHIFAGISVVALGIILQVSLTDWCLLILSIGMVFTAELFNTSLEYLTDLLSPEIRKKAGLTKDIAAAGVLVSAITAVAIGLIVFLPKLIEIFSF